MYNRIKHILTFLWPFLESVILALLIGMMTNSFAATMVVVFIVIFVFTLIYGTIIKSIGWGIYGFLLSPGFLVSVLLFILFFLIRYYLPKAINKLVS